MINSLFTSFDPIGSLIRLNYTRIFLLFLLSFFFMFFFIPSRLSFLNTFSIFKPIFTEIRFSVLNNNKKGKIILLVSIFYFILVINIIGLVPYIFTTTAHIIFTLILAFPFWISIVLFRITQQTNHFLRHLVPLRTPLPLSQFMVLIELTRQLIRPITLSVRLAANITAGHILIALTRSPITFIRTRRFILIMLIILETAVAVIQAYVFTTLLSIYLREV